MKATREEVYKAIDSEREYQNNLPCDRTEFCGLPETIRNVAEYLVMLDYYIRQAKDDWTNQAGEQAALNVVRKIAGIAVHCMEDNGAIPRNQ